MSWLAWTAAVGLGFACVIAARRNFGVATIVGTSMQPTLQPGDRVLYRRGNRVAVGRMVVLETVKLEALVEAAEGIAARSPALIIKRVAAVAGEPWPDWAPRAIAAQVVPAGQLLVLGDSNRSLDSKQWGAVPVEVVHGAVLRTLADGR